MLNSRTIYLDPVTLVTAAAHTRRDGITLSHSGNLSHVGINSQASPLTQFTFSHSCLAGVRCKLCLLRTGFNSLSTATSVGSAASVP